VWSRTRRPASSLDDVVELLEGVGTILMEISAQLDVIVEILRGEDNEDPDA